MDRLATKAISKISTFQRKALPLDLEIPLSGGKGVCSKRLNPVYRLVNETIL